MRCSKFSAEKLARMVLAHPAAVLIFVALALAIVVLAFRCQAIEFKNGAIRFGFPASSGRSLLRQGGDRRRLHRVELGSPGRVPAIRGHRGGGAVGLLASAARRRARTRP